MTIELEKASEAAPRPELDWERDWQGRPRILPDPTWTPEQVQAWQSDRADDQGRVPYTRVTTFCEAMQDASALARWKMRRVALGMGRRPDYVVTAASLTTEDRDRDAADDLAEKALEAAGPNAADVGTAVHSFTERLDRGEELGPVPEPYAADVEAYARAAGHLRFVEWECRTVCDLLETAGTPDRVGWCDVPDPDGVVDELRIIDTKTGRVDYSAGKFATQLAVYAHSDLYHPGTGARTGWEDAHGSELNTRWGLIVHVPAGSGTAELLWIDLEHGWAGAQEAGRVRRWRAGATARALLRPVFARAPRPRPTDGTCRGRQQDGKACGYRAKRVDGQLTDWCGRHQAQQDGLERWLAENPGVDPASGEESQPATQPTEAPEQTREDVRAAVDAGLSASLGVTVHSNWAAIDAGNAAREDALVAMAPLAEDETDATAEQLGALLDAGTPVQVIVPDRCRTTGLIIEQCACPVHRPDLAGTHGTGMIMGTGSMPSERLTEDLPPARDLAAAAFAQARLSALEAGEAEPELNGNRRPVSGLQDALAVGMAAWRARSAVVDQLQAAQSESDLLVIYQANRNVWTPELTAAAGARSAELAQQQAAERPEAALLAAIRTAPDREILARLWEEYGGLQLWQAEHTEAANVRHWELAKL